MTTRGEKYERIFPMTQQQKTNIGQGKVLKGLIRKGELPKYTTLTEAQELGLDLSKRPRKGVRKKGLLPELTKKQYKDQLGKKIKDFTKEEKRIYNALAKREARGYIPKPELELAQDIEDFLAEDIEEITAEITEAPPEKQVAIPKGISSKVGETIVPDIDYSSDSSEYSDGDIEFVSVLSGLPLVDKPSTRKRQGVPSREEILGGDTDTRMKEKLQRSRLSFQLALAGGESKEDREAAKERVRKRKEEQRLKKQEEEDLLAKELEEELGEDLGEATIPDAPAKTTEEYYRDLMRGMSVAEYRAETQRTLDFIDRYSALPEVRARVGFAPPPPTEEEIELLPTLSSVSSESSLETPRVVRPIRGAGGKQPRENIPTTPNNPLPTPSPKQRTKRTPPTRQQKVGVPTNTKKSLEEAGVGSLSLGQRLVLSEVERQGVNPTLYGEGFSLKPPRQPTSQTIFDFTQAGRRSRVPDWALRPYPDK